MICNSDSVNKIIDNMENLCLTSCHTYVFHETCVTALSEKSKTEHALDPKLQKILAAAPPLRSMELSAMRAHAIDGKRYWNDAPRPWLDLAEDSTLSRLVGRPVKRFRSCHSDAPPLVWMHGGGWSIGSISTHHAVFAELSQFCRRDVIALHPRQAPEHPYPAPVKDVAALLVALRGPFHLGGDSAGANLALGGLACLHANGQPVFPRSLTLAYGCFQARFDTESHVAFGSSPVSLSTAKMRQFWSFYGGTGQPFADFATLPNINLPPTQLHIAALDPLRDDSLDIEAQLHDLGVSVDRRDWAGMTHGFLHYLPDLPQAMSAIEAISNHLERNDT